MKEQKLARPGNPQAEQKGLIWNIFLSTLYLSTFTFGGGYVIITLMKKKFVDKHHWMEQEEMLDLAAIAQSAPGSIAVNAAILAGFKLAGLPGVLAAVAGTVLPPFTILTLLSFCYTAFRSNQIAGWMLNGMQAGVGAVIAQAVWDIAGGIVKSRQAGSVLIMAAAFGASCLFQVNTILIILVCAVLGIILSLWKPRQSSRGKGGGA